MTTLKWWQRAVFYQIYPRSFADGNGDGIGDFLGMIEKLDYLQDLGVDAIWLSPHFPSPQVDVGYDISDYLGVAEEYGTLADFKAFLAGAHQRGMRVILDLVLNHTSDQHAWFQASRSSREDPKRDWYVWRDGRDGGLPNNWWSAFGGPAWEYDEGTGQYYYHFFFKEQPDLNWRNPAVQKAMWEAARFWLDLGVDGFRLDAIGTIFEHPRFIDSPVKRTMVELQMALMNAKTDGERRELGKEYDLLFKYQVEFPEVQDLMRDLRRVTDEYPDRMLVGEDERIAYYGDGTDMLQLVFNFPLMHTERITPAWVRANQRNRLGALPPGAWPCNTLGNHDSPRLYSRYGDGTHDAQIARLCVALMLTLRGTPFLYNGEEIGMTDLMLSDPSLFRDNISVYAYRELVNQYGFPPDQALKIAIDAGRDKNRTPMQWANVPNAGFSPAKIKTWLPVNPNYAQGVNVAEQANEPGSLLNFYKRMLSLRRRTPALISGDFQVLNPKSRNYLAFLRRSQEEDQTCLVVLNMSVEKLNIRLDLGGRNLQVLFSSTQRIGESDDPLSLKIAPHEIFIAEVN